MRWKYHCLAIFILAGLGYWLISILAVEESDTPAANQALEAPRAGNAGTSAAYAAAAAASASGNPFQRLPPSPFAATDQTDVDENHDGIPDRVNRYIEQEYKDSAVTRRAFTQLASAWGEALNKVRDPESAKAAGEKISQGIGCVLSQAVISKGKTDFDSMQDRILKTRAKMLANEANTQAYLRFQELASGQYFKDPGTSSCAFETGQFAN